MIFFAGRGYPKAGNEGLSGSAEGKVRVVVRGANPNTRGPHVRSAA